MATKSRLAGLDALRGLACTLVLLFHYTIDYPTKFGWANGSHTSFNVPLGSMGVRIFFVISGFVILMSLERSASPRAFAVSRIARIYPAYVVAAALTLLLIGITGYNPRLVTWGDEPFNAFFSATLLGHTHIDAPYWTLTREFYFYILAALAYFGLAAPGSGRTRMLWAVAVWLLVTIPWNVLVADAHFYSDHTAVSVASILINSQFAYLFAIGILIYQLRSGTHDRRAVLAVMALAVVAAGFAEWPANGRHFAPGQCMRAALYGGIVYAFSAPSVLYRWLRPMVFMGEYSYAIYLLHETIGYFIISRMQAAGQSPMASIAVACAVVIALAIALRTAVEVPGRAFILKHFGKGPARPVA